MVREETSDLQTRDLLVRARAGRHGAWEELYRRYRALLIFTVRTQHRGRFRNRFDTDDVLQSAFLTAWAEIEAFEYRGEGSFRRWLARLVTNKLRDLGDYHNTRSRSVDGEVHEDGPVDDPDVEALHERIASEESGPLEQARDSEEQGALLEAMSTLEEAEQEVLCMRQFEHLAWNEIANILGTSQSSARRRWAAALERLTSAML